MRSPIESRKSPPAFRELLDSVVASPTPLLGNGWKLLSTFPKGQLTLVLNYLSVAECSAFDLLFICVQCTVEHSNIGSVVEWLEPRNCDQYGLGSKPTRAILLYPWERHFTALSPAWWSWQGVLNFSHISIEFQAEISWYLRKQVRVIAYLCISASSLSCESGG